MKAKLNLKRAIKDFGSTNTAVAGQLGITVPSLYSYFKGNPSVETIYRISEILNADPRDLFYAVDSEGNEVSHEEERQQMEQNRLKKEQNTQVMEQNEVKMAQNTPQLEHKTADMEIQAGSIDNSIKTYICPHCGTKFLVLSEPQE